MYLYFDKKGTLREIINDEALRQGNYGVNKMYVYFDNGVDGLHSTLYGSIDVSYVLPSGAFVETQNYNTFENAQIPYDQKRDLRFFRYGQTYKFCVIDMEPEPGEEENTFGDSPLQENGVVHCSMTVNLTPSGQKQLGDVNFEVEGAAALQLGTVGPEHYLSLANYQYLRQLLTDADFDNKVPYTGATNNVDLGEYHLNATFVGVGDSSEGAGLYKSSIFHFKTAGGVLEYLNFPNESGVRTIATREWVNTKLPSQGVCAQFETSEFVEDSEYGNYYLNDITVSNFITGSNMLIITWGNCYALCPIPVDGGAGRVVAAMWNSNGEAQTIRVRYRLKDTNTKLDISLQGGFTPPDNFTAYVQCIKLFN